MGATADAGAPSNYRFLAAVTWVNDDIVHATVGTHFRRSGLERDTAPSDGHPSGAARLALYCPWIKV